MDPYRTEKHQRERNLSPLRNKWTFFHKQRKYMQCRRMKQPINHNSYISRGGDVFTTPLMRYFQMDSMTIYSHEIKFMLHKIKYLHGSSCFRSDDGEQRVDDGGAAERPATLSTVTGD